MMYELREQSSLWHIVEPGTVSALCGHAVDQGSAARPLADLAEIDLDRCCGPCEQRYRTMAAEALDQPAG